VERASSSSDAPGATNDAFGLLGLPARFDLDPKLIEQAFFDKSKELHPDRFASAPAAERVVALSRSRALNDAYQQIKKPVPRAEYLLSRAGVSIGENERIADAGFLMEILEMREELAEARVAKRTSEVEKLCADMTARRKAVVDSLSPLFDKNDLPAIKEQLIVLRYLDRYLEECDAALDED
jgi:molecular chaperone HscB